MAHFCIRQAPHRRVFTCSVPAGYQAQSARLCRVVCLKLSVWADVEQIRRLHIPGLCFARKPRAIREGMRIYTISDSRKTGVNQILIFIVDPEGVGGSFRRQVALFLSRR